MDVYVHPRWPQTSGPAQSEVAVTILNSNGPLLTQQSMDGITIADPSQLALVATIALD